MDEQPSESGAAADRRLERAIILALLGSGGELRWAPAELAAELGVEPRALGQALDRLSRAGVVCVNGTDVRASCAARCIDELGLIGI